MKKRNFILGAIILFFSMSASYAGTLNWTADGDPDTGPYLYDQDSSTKLATGCLVQLILDVDGDGLDSIEFSGFATPAGDDILMPNSAGGNTGEIGDGMGIFNVLGHFLITTTFDNLDPAPNYTGGDVYVRFWNAASPVNGDYYGESAAYTLLSGDSSQPFDIISGGSLSTGIHLVAEPRGSVLMLSGLIPVFIIGYFRKRNRKAGSVA